MAGRTNNERFHRPSINLVELLKKNFSGAFVERGDYLPFMFRALCLAVDTEGGKLETPDGKPEGTGLNVEIRESGTTKPLASYSVSPTFGPRNPKDSIRARIISADHDRFVDDDSLRTYWPLFPGLATPSPGELVYVVFEDDSRTHGLWLGKVPSNLPNENANQILMGQQLRQAHDSKITLYPDTQTTGERDRTGQEIKQPNRLSNMFK